MESTRRKIGVVFAVIISGMLAYAVFPALLKLIVPSAPLPWKPIFSVSQALSMFGVFIAIGVILAVASRLRYAMTTGNPVIEDDDSEQSDWVRAHR